jgi:hypothetical protein
MLRTYPVLLSLVPAMALGYLACGGEDPVVDRESLGADGAAIIAPSPALIGTFRALKVEAGGLSLLALKSDGTFHRELLVGCVERKCDFKMDDGIFTLSVHDGAPILSLHPPRGGAADDYHYLLRGGRLGLSPVNREGWTVLGKADGAAWCEVTTDCALQNLPEGPCATDWYCKEKVCQYSCQPPAEIE